MDENKKIGLAEKSYFDRLVARFIWFLRSLSVGWYRRVSGTVSDGKTSFLV